MLCSLRRNVNKCLVCWFLWSVVYVLAVSLCSNSLPVPWLLYSVFHGFAPVAVSSNGLFCAIVLLFIMLLFVIISIASCKWSMSRALGFTMFLLYFIFLVLSVMLEDRIIVCPVSIWWCEQRTSLQQEFLWLWTEAEMISWVLGNSRICSSLPSVGKLLFAKITARLFPNKIMAEDTKPFLQRVRKFTTPGIQTYFMFTNNTASEISDT